MLCEFGFRMGGFEIWGWFEITSVEVVLEKFFDLFYVVVQREVTRYIALLMRIFRPLNLYPWIVIGLMSKKSLP